jgi:hypothetical protein
VRASRLRPDQRFDARTVPHVARVRERLRDANARANARVAARSVV